MGSRSFSPEEFGRVVRVVYVERGFLERMVRLAVKVLGHRAMVARLLGYRNSTRLNKILDGRVGMACARFLRLCEISGIPFGEALKYVLAVVP
jgi:hypothetical protein